MTIEQAYEAMKEGHKVAHSSYDEDEFNYMEEAMIKDENGYHWGLKGDEPWNMRVKNEWFKDEWFVCNNRQLKEKQVLKSYQEEFLRGISSNREQIAIAIPPRNRGLTTLVSEEVKKNAINNKDYKIEIPKGYMQSLGIITAMSEEFNQNRNEYAGNKDGSQGFTAKKNRELNDSWDYQYKNIIRMERNKNNKKKKRRK